MASTLNSGVLIGEFPKIKVHLVGMSSVLNPFKLFGLNLKFWAVTFTPS